MADMKKQLSAKQTSEIIVVLKNRFEKNLHRHRNIEWDQIELKLKSNPEKLWSLNEMESTGGEPDVVSFDKSENEIVFYDC
mgnify:FL=1